MNIKAKLGIKIKSIRLEKKISQEKLAHLSDLDRTYIHSIEKGERNISIVTIEKISKGLNIQISELLKDL
ncbi:helix-turn-helix domain-containing protein [Tenacibaculum dicentrarchi]|nr:helix-turn-helix domain-containing protein [Tenacibaculum dicentrarchi]|tara:strand:- start:1420 stop:1629 length:210 start_codon:yes stop_codon:yes gene_type:complete